MSSHDQIEIVGSDGQIEFYSLDPDKGITNIGRHPENDLVLDDAQIAPFHAMLDHRQKPYQLIVLDAETETALENEPLDPHVATDVQNWNNIKLGNYTLILVENVDTTATQSPAFSGSAPSGTMISTPPAQVPTAPLPPPQPSESPASPSAPTPTFPSRPPSRPVSVPPPTTRPEASPSNAYASHPMPTTPPEPTRMAAQGVSAAVGYFNTRPADQEDPLVISELFEKEWEGDVEQSAIFQLNIRNGGQYVAAFYIGIEGLPEGWVNEISPSYVHLNEGEPATVTITITPPRHPSSRAGAHHFAIVVYSPNYPNHVSRRGATLTVNPYYDFGVEELSPRRQTISWRRHFGEATLPIINKGNSPVAVRVEGMDEERACNFEFNVPSQPMPMATRAEVVLHPEEIYPMPISITPHSRRLIGFRKRRYSFNITANLAEGQLMPRSLLGELLSKPLIGPWVFILMSLLLIILLLFLARPRLNMFKFRDGGQAKIISNGTPVALLWEASLFTTDRSIVANTGPIEELEQPVARRGTTVTYPKSNTTYTFMGGNILSRFAPAIFPPPIETIEVDVNPVAPTVVFDAQPGVTIVGEDEVTLSWAVQNADKIELYRRVGDVSAPEEFVGDFSDRPAGAIQVTPEPDQETTTFILKASNVYASTPTPEARPIAAHTPTPEIFISANPVVINEGESSTLSWRATGVQQVTLQDPGGVTSQQRPEDQTLIFPATSGDYTLIAGQNVGKVRIEVIPATPTATTTPEPDAPQIILFSAQPKELVEGDEDQVELSWQINENFTNGEISSPDLGIIPFTDQIGSIIVTVKETTLFALTAFNGDKQSSTTTGVDVLTPTPTTTPPPPTDTPIPPAVITKFEIITPEAPLVVNLGGSNPQKYEVQINTDVVFEWNTINAVKITLTEPNKSQEVGAIGKITSLIDSKGTKSYVLIAENSAGDRVSKAIEIQVFDQPPPDPPFDLIGTEMAPEIDLEWKWVPDPAKSDIIGFRVFRADSPPGTNFQQVEEILDITIKEWTDPNPGSVCGKAYLVRAIYEDINGVIQVSGVSNNWQSSPCP